jgi:hypothetical protein
LHQITTEQFIPSFCQLFKRRALPVLDPERRAIIVLVALEVILGRVGEKVRGNKESRVGSFSMGPGEKTLELLRWNTLCVVFAFHKPGLEVTGVVNVNALKLTHDVPSSIGRAGGEAGTLPPIEVDKPQFAQEIETELLELCFAQVIETDGCFQKRETLNSSLINWTEAWLGLAHRKPIQRPGGTIRYRDQRGEAPSGRKYGLPNSNGKHVSYGGKGCRDCFNSGRLSWLQRLGCERGVPLGSV